MKQKTKRTPLQKHDIRVTALIISIGAIMMLGTLFFSIEYSRREAQKTMDRNISDLKKQINDYNEFLAADEVKSLIRLTEKAESLSEALAMLDDGARQEYIERIYDSQRLSCILVLDENLNPDNFMRTVKCNGTADECYESWIAELQSPAIKAISDHPKKVYSARIRHGGDNYDIAAVARTDAKGIIFCASRQADKKLELHYSPVRNLLARNETRLDGTLCIAEDGRIIATNLDGAYTGADEIPELTALKERKAGNELTRIVSGGDVFYGGIVKCRNYDIYAFYPAGAIYSPCRAIMLFAFSVYVMIVFIIGFFHFKARAERAREINRQYETIQAISHVYSLTALIDLKANHYELLKYPPDLSNVAKDGTLDTRFCKEIIGYVDERFREGYRDFLNTETMTERLAEAEYAEYEYQNRNGDWINDKLIVREKDKEGRVDSVILARSSINEQKKAELEYQAKLETAVRNEQTANQSKTDFLRRMSHDIRTPINVILGMLEIANRNPTDTELLASCRSKTQTAAEYLLELVNDILTLNRAGVRNSDDIPMTEEFRLQEEVRKLYLIAAETAKRYDGVILEPFRISGEDKPLVGEPLYLRQIMINIIANAIRYSKNGGTVRCSVSQNPAQNRDGYAEVRFICEDNGIGMSKEFQKRMFEPFAQESAVSVSHFGGVGLGLSIVQKLVDRLNGTIEVDSEQGRGTRFEVKIFYPYANTHDEAETHTYANASLAGLTVLIVEDNELNMEIAGYMAAEAGASVVRAFDGRQAVEIFAASAVGEINVILTDVIMPEMDGLEETRRIRALDRPDAKTVPIIAMTANLFEDDIREYTDAGMTGVLPKPLNMSQLVETVAKQTAKGGKNNG